MHVLAWGPWEGEIWGDNVEILPHDVEQRADSPAADGVGCYIKFSTMKGPPSHRFAAMQTFVKKFFDYTCYALLSQISAFSVIYQSYVIDDVIRMLIDTYVRDQ